LRSAERTHVATSKQVLHVVSTVIQYQMTLQSSARTLHWASNPSSQICIFSTRNQFTTPYACVACRRPRSHAVIVAIVAAAPQQRLAAFHPASVAAKTILHQRTPIERYAFSVIRKLQTQCLKKNIRCCNATSSAASASAYSSLVYSSAGSQARSCYAARWHQVLTHRAFSISLSSLHRVIQPARPC